MLNPYILLAIVLFYAGSIGAVGYKAYHLGGEHVIAEQAETQELIDKVYDKAQRGAAEAISKMKVVNQTVNRRVETIAREKIVYRECVNDPTVERMLDDARAGKASSESAGDGGVPGTGPSTP